MTNLEVAGMKPGEFSAAYEKVKTANFEKRPINCATASLDNQLENFEASSFSDEDFQALHEDLLSI
jgi:hypothetical protein